MAAETVSETVEENGGTVQTPVQAPVQDDFIIWTDKEREKP